MKEKHYCPRCGKPQRSYFKRFPQLIEDTTVEKGPFYVCRNKTCILSLKINCDTTIDQTLTPPFIWVQRVPTEEVFDMVK